jgi:negative regulator of genetic competence, sporulation and motility
MELIRISDQKLKIMLTPMDMSHFELDSANFGEDSAQMHRSFRLLLAEIHQQTGFDADDTHISVQYFPSREGGCEMFISNLQNEEAECKKSANTLSVAEKNNLQLRPLKNSGGSFRKDCAYRFEKLCHLLSACKRLYEIGFVCDSAAWKDEKKAYYLFLSLLSASAFSTPEELDFIVEYGTIENASILHLYIREHGTVICPQNAILELSQFG